MPDAELVPQPHGGMLKRGGVNPGAGRKSKDYKAKWSGVGDRVFEIAEAVLDHMEREVEQAKKSKRMPKVDPALLLKLMEYSTKYGQQSDEGEKAKDQLLGDLEPYLDKLYGDPDAKAGKVRRGSRKGRSPKSSDRKVDPVPDHSDSTAT